MSTIGTSNGRRIRWKRWALAFAVFIVTWMGFVLGPGYLRAQNPMESGPAVRHRILYRSGRLELTPLAGISVNEPYLRDVAGGLDVKYHVTDQFSLGLMGGVGLVQMATNLNDSNRKELGRKKPEQLNKVSYSYLKWLAGLEVGYVPIFGKVSTFGAFTTHYDIHLIGGMALVKEGAQPAVQGGDTDPRLGARHAAPVVGIGSRLFLQDWISLNFEVRDYVYSTASVSSGTANPTFQNNFLFTVGVGFYLPSEPLVSR